MRPTLICIWTLLALTLSAAAAQAQTPDAITRARLDTLLTAAAGTPDGKGLVPAAIAEGRTALAEAVRAAQAPTDLALMRASADRVLHAIDPARSKDPSGYGVTRALVEIVGEVTLTATADGKRDVAVAAPRALADAQQAQTVAAALILVAEQIVAARTAVEASLLTRELAERAGELLAGVRGWPRGKPGPIGGLFGIQAHLAGVYAARTGAFPAALKEGRPR